MWPAWLQLLAARPQLLAEHGQAYAQLLGEESGLVLDGCRRRLLWSMSAGLCALLFLMLAGVAGLLAAVLPPGPMPQPWLLVALPSLPLGVSLACWWQAARVPLQLFVGLQQQLRADTQLLQELLTRPAPGAMP